MTPRITASTPPSDWPLLLTLKETALVLGRSPKAMANRCCEGVCWPPPVLTSEGFYQRPYRWHRDLLCRYIGGELAKPARYFRRAARTRSAA